MRNIPYYCQKVLPLVYDDSLSYYEAVCKLTAKMNEIIDNFNNDFKDIIQDNIEKYFNEIMTETMYIEDTKTIRFSIVNINSDGDGHTFLTDEETMLIGGGTCQN